MLIDAPVGGMIRSPNGEGEIVSTRLPRLRGARRALSPPRRSGVWES